MKPFTIPASSSPVLHPANHSRCLFLFKLLSPSPQLGKTALLCLSSPSLSCTAEKCYQGESLGECKGHSFTSLVSDMIFLLSFPVVYGKSSTNYSFMKLKSSKQLSSSVYQFPSFSPTKGHLSGSSSMSIPHYQIFVLYWIIPTI